MMLGVMPGRFTPFGAAAADGASAELSLVNFTQHPVIIVADHDAVVEIAPSGRVARCLVDPDRPLGVISLDGHAVPLMTNATTAAVEGLPDPEPGVLLIVSRLVALAVPERRDLVFPHIAVRDDVGRTAGCRALAQVPAPTR